MSNQASSTATILLAFIGGAALGASVALLTAPQSGAETRAQLSGAISRRKKQLAQLPPAVRDAYLAASDAAKSTFQDAYNEQIEAQ